MKYLNSTIRKYLADVSAKTPAPGGGSAAALALAVAASLVVMVCRFTIGRKKYRRWEERLKNNLQKSLEVQRKAARLIDEDVAAYQRKDLRGAIRVPAEVCTLSYETIRLAYELLLCGNKNLISDTAMALLLAELSFISGLAYVRANIEFLKKPTREQERVLKKLKALLKKTRQVKKRAEVQIGTSFRR
jgi:formiminotetrahydrofolate cyclodeaminase